MDIQATRFNTVTFVFWEKNVNYNLIRLNFNCETNYLNLYANDLHISDMVVQALLEPTVPGLRGTDLYIAFIL